MSPSHSTRLEDGSPGADDRRLSELLDLAGHELREPLTVVSGSAQLLKSRESAQFDDASARDIERILAGTRLMHERIDDMILYARAGSDALYPAEVDCGELLGAELPTLARAIEDARATVRGEGLPTVRADREKLGLVLRNVVGSALLRSDGEALRVEVTAGRAEGAWRLSVGDDGLSIDPVDVERLFEPFGSRGAHGGASSALATCLRIVERHGGTMGYERRAEGGSVIWLTLPDGPTVGA